MSTLFHAFSSTGYFAASRVKVPSPFEKKRTAPLTMLREKTPSWAMMVASASLPGK
jgi:hypothetical protein